MTNCDCVRIAGILNITEDSFSDGGLYLDSGAALARAGELLEDGADLIDIGPASSHPDSCEVSAEEEIRRLRPLLEGGLPPGIEISVDSWRPQTQLFAISKGVSYLNDIRGFAYPEIYPRLAAARCRLIVMHSLSGGGKALREDAGPEQVWKSIREFFDTRLAALEGAGVARERMILDPGMGFFLGSRVESSVCVLRRLAQLKERYALPLMVSVSRKSFLGALSKRKAADRGAATLAAELYAATHGADFIRTHDVASLRAALAVHSALTG